MTIGIDYGVMAGTIESQLNAQGYSIFHLDERYEKVKIAINMCMFHCATQREVEAMRKRLHKKVIADMLPLYKTEDVMK